VSGGAVGVTDGVNLGNLNKTIVFDVQGTAKDIYDNRTVLNEASNVSVVSGGPEISVVQANAIQQMTNYRPGSSHYSIDDIASNITAAGDGVLANGNIAVEVTSGPVLAVDGATLTGFTADIDFDVEDNADQIYLAISQDVTALDDADSVAVISGDVTVAEADAIQDISGYFNATNSDYDISDTAAAILSGGDAVLNVTGVDVVTVTDGPVVASDGVLLDGFTADVEFDVSDNADDIYLAISQDGSALDEANSVAVISGDVTVAEADAIQDISG
jgi:tRNA threonylcarbamoyladenosine modification (KEOPS) complex  Pcc1 subunit